MKTNISVYKIESMQYFLLHYICNEKRVWERKENISKKIKVTCSIRDYILQQMSYLPCRLHLQGCTGSPLLSPCFTTRKILWINKDEKRPRRTIYCQKATVTKTDILDFFVIKLSAYFLLSKTADGDIKNNNNKIDYYF